MWFEVIVCALLIYGGITGWKHGLIKELCSTFGFLIGIGVAIKYYDIIGYGIWGFALVCLVCPIVLGMVSSLVSAIINRLFVIGLVHRFAGALLGIAKYIVLLAMTYWLGERMGFMD